MFHNHPFFLKFLFEVHCNYIFQYNAKVLCLHHRGIGNSECHVWFTVSPKRFPYVALVIHLRFSVNALGRVVGALFLRSPLTEKPY